MSRLKDWRYIDQGENTKNVNENLSILPVHSKLRQLDLDNVMMGNVATSVYLSAMWDEERVYPKRESGFAFKPRMNNVYLYAFSNQTFNQKGDENEILKNEYYNPPTLFFSKS